MRTFRSSALDPGLAGPTARRRRGRRGRDAAVAYLCAAALVALFGGGTGRAFATPLINVGEFTLQPNTPGQVVDIYVSGTEHVEGLTLNVQVADGGPEVGGSVVGPKITAVDVLTGTIFAGNNTGQREIDTQSFSQIKVIATSTGTGSVLVSGKLARLTIDTSGLGLGAWELLLAGTLNGDTKFSDSSGDVDIEIHNGLITTPEPAAALVAALAGASALLRRRRPRSLRVR